MGNMRFNHMELTLPLGTLNDEFRAEAREFYGDVFGWTATDTQILKQTGLLLSTDSVTSQFILLLEHRQPMTPPPFDHLGVLCDTRTEVDAVLAKCEAFQEKDPRVEIKRYQDLVTPTITIHAFYVRHLLPIHLDVQCMERPDGVSAPFGRWVWVED